MDGLYNPSIMMIGNIMKEEIMKKWKIFVGVVVIALILCTGLTFAGGKKEAETADEKKVTITVTSWRTEDVAGMNKLHAAFQKKNPNIQVDFAPVKNTEYYAQLGTALETGTGVADVISLHSYGTGLGIYKGGHLAELQDAFPEINNVSSQAKEPWSSNGVVYGIPWIAVSHGIYYNKDIFDEYGLTEPETWEEFIEACDTLAENGVTPIAAGSKDSWTLNAMHYCNYGSTFYGGEKSRQDLMAGTMKVTDELFIEAFEKVNSLVKYFSKGYQAIDYVSSQQMFITEQAAIFPGGSWEIAPFDNMGLDFDLGWFPPPVKKKGDKITYVWNAGLGMGMYKDTPHPEEVKKYLAWMLTPEASTITMNVLPGFYSYLPGDYELDNPLSIEMFNVSLDAELTERLTYEKLSDQEPSGTALFYEGLTKMVNGELSPAETAEYIQERLESWYPFK